MIFFPRKDSYCLYKITPKICTSIITIFPECRTWAILTVSRQSSYIYISHNCLSKRDSRNGWQIFRFVFHAVHIKSHITNRMFETINLLFIIEYNVLCSILITFQLFSMLMIFSIRRLSMIDLVFQMNINEDKHLKVHTIHKRFGSCIQLS